MDEASTSLVNVTTNQDTFVLLTVDVGTKVSRARAGVTENEVQAELRAKALELNLEQLQREYDEKLKKLEQLDEIHIVKENQTYSEMDNASSKKSIGISLFNVENAYNFIATPDKCEAELQFLKDFYNENNLWKESTALDLEMREKCAPQFEQNKLEKIMEDLRSEKASQKIASVLDKENSDLIKEIEFLTAEINKSRTDESVEIEVNKNKNIIPDQLDSAQQFLQTIQSEIESIGDNKETTIEKLDQEFLKKVTINKELSQKADNMRSQSTRILETWQKKLINRRKMFDELNKLEVNLQTNKFSLQNLEMKINKHAEKLESFSQLLFTFESSQVHIPDLTNLYQEVNMKYDTKREELENDIQAQQQKTVSSTKLPAMNDELAAQLVKLQSLQEEMENKNRLFEKLQKAKSELVAQLGSYKVKGERNAAPRDGTGTQNAFGAGIVGQKH